MEEGRESSACSMVSFLGIMIQLGLGVLSFSVLVLKRCRERPRRPWKIWALDTSKQLLSQLLAHFINLTISIGLASSDASSDECLWYLTTNILDNTLGVLLCLSALRAVEHVLARTRRQQYISGNYYSRQAPALEIEITCLPRRAGELVEEREGAGEGAGGVGSKIDYRCWLVQLLIWVGIVVVGKSVIFGVEMGLEGQLKALSSCLLGWIQAYQVLQLVLVIVVVPLIMNGFAFWVQDSFLKRGEQMGA